MFEVDDGKHDGKSGKKRGISVHGHMRKEGCKESGSLMEEETEKSGGGRVRRSG